MAGAPDLPLELVLNVLEWSARDPRAKLRWKMSLLLVSRASYRWILPLAYRSLRVTPTNFAEVLAQIDGGNAGFMHVRILQFDLQDHWGLDVETAWAMDHRIRALPRLQRFRGDTEIFLQFSQLEGFSFTPTHAGLFVSMPPRFVSMPPRFFTIEISKRLSRLTHLYLEYFPPLHTPANADPVWPPRLSHIILHPKALREPHRFHEDIPSILAAPDIVRLVAHLFSPHGYIEFDELYRQAASSLRQFAVDRRERRLYLVTTFVEFDMENDAHWSGGECLFEA